MNRVELVGRLVRDPEVRTSGTGTAVLKFTTAVDRRRQVRPGEPTADFISCTAFGKTAENMGRYLHKGSLIAVEGRIETGSYVNSQGQKVYTTDVIADSVQFLESKNASRSGGYEQSGGYSANSYGQQGYDGGYGGYTASSSNYSTPPQRNPYAQSVDSGFNGSSSPAGFQGGYQNTAGNAPRKDYSSSASADEGADLFADDDDLGIASDDLPF